MPASPSAAARDARTWATLALLLLVLFVFFRAFVLREVAWAYPADYDQTKYLGISYSTYEAVLQRGFVPGLAGWVTTAYENGMLIHLPAVVLMLAFGPGRLTVLSVNFCALVLYVLVLAAVVRRASGSGRMALMSAGLALGTGSYWFQNQVDYRLDFSSLCLFGIFVSLVMRSAVFRERGWAVAAGAAAAVLVANRFLTSLYVAGIYAGMLVYFAAVCPLVLKRRERAALTNVVLSAAAGAALSVPVVLVSWRAIYGYYVVQQGIEEAVRDAEFSVASALEFWLYYPQSLIVHHVGLPLAVASLGVLLLGIAAAARRRRAGGRITVPAWLTDAAVFLALGFAVILGTLTANITRSPVVGGTAVPLFTWSVVIAGIALFGSATPINARGSRLAAAAAAIALGIAVSAQLAFYTSSYRFSRNRADVEDIARMHADIGRYAEAVGLSSPMVASDSQRDYLAAGAIAAAYYEAGGRWMPFRSGLASAVVMAVPRAVLLGHLAGADFLILTHRRDPMEPPYPIIDAVEGVRAEMNEESRRLLPLGEYTIFRRLVSLYARPSARVVSGQSGNWIVHDGLVVEVPARIAATPSDLVLNAAMNPWIDPALKVGCESREGGVLRTLESGFTVEAEAYTARCALPRDADGDGAVRVRMFFSHYFVPSERGLNEDPRRLVLLAPPRPEIVPREPASSR